MSETIRVLVVDDLPETRENIRKLLQFEPDIAVIAQAGSGDQAIEMAKQHLPDIVLMDINMPGIDGITASRTINLSVPTAQIVIMSVQSESDYLRRAMLAGARDFLMKPFSGDELVAAIRRVHKIRPLLAIMPADGHKAGNSAAGRLAPAPREGKLVTVFSPKGGSGRSTIAVNLAVALANQRHHTLLVDGSFQFSSVDVMLNIKPTTSIADLVDRVNDLDRDLINSVVITHRTGLKVLLAPPRPEMAELITAAHLEALLPKLRRIFDFVVVDSASSLNEITLAMLDNSDRILLVTEQTLPSLKNVSRFFDLTEELNYEPARVMLVVNRVTAKPGITIKDISSILKRPIVMTVPADEMVANSSADQGKALVSGRWQNRPIAVSLTKLAAQITRELMPMSEQASPRVNGSASPSRLERLFGGRWRIMMPEDKNVTFKAN